jgi:hypothetical protein
VQILARRNRARWIQHVLSKHERPVTFAEFPGQKHLLGHRLQVLVVARSKLRNIWRGAIAGQDSKRANAKAAAASAHSEM